MPAGSINYLSTTKLPTNEYEARLQDIQRRQAMAAMLTGSGVRGATEGPGYQVIGQGNMQRVVPKAATQHLADLLRTGVGVWGAEKSKDEITALSAERQKIVTDGIAAYSAALQRGDLAGAASAAIQAGTQAGYDALTSAGMQLAAQSGSAAMMRNIWGAGNGSQAAPQPAQQPLPGQVMPTPSGGSPSAPQGPQGGPQAGAPPWANINPSDPRIMQTAMVPGMSGVAGLMQKGAIANQGNMVDWAKMAQADRHFNSLSASQKADLRLKGINSGIDLYKAWDAGIIPMGQVPGLPAQGGTRPSGQATPAGFPRETPEQRGNARAKQIGILQDERSMEQVALAEAKDPAAIQNHKQNIAAIDRELARFGVKPQGGGQGGGDADLSPAARRKLAEERKRIPITASIEATKEFMSEMRKNYSTLRDSATFLRNVDKAKALAAGDARMFMGPLGELKLNVVKFLRANVPGMGDLNAGNVSSVEELRTRLFEQVKENLKKMDATPSQYQQKIMSDAFGTLGTDPTAIARILDVLAESVRERVTIHNRTVEDAEAGGIKFPYSVKIILPGAPRSAAPGTPAAPDDSGIEVISIQPGG